MRWPAHWFADRLIRPPLLNATDAAEGAIMTSSIQEFVAQARSQIRNLTVDEFARELEADTVTIIDIREPDEVGHTGAIPGAIQAPRGMLEFWADPASPYHRMEFDPASRTLLYCAFGRSLSAGRPEPANPRLRRRRAPRRRTEGLGGARRPRDPPRTELSEPTTAAAQLLVASVLLLSDAVMRQAARRGHHKLALSGRNDPKLVARCKPDRSGRRAAPAFRRGCGASPTHTAPSS
jgi:rhodanese-related sulfurtransferase